MLNLRLADDIDQEVFARKSTEIRDRLASIKLQIDALDRSHDETAELASKVFELSQTLRQQWLTADYDAKRRILEIVCLNCTLDGATLVPEIRKPFDVLAEGLLSEKKSGRLYTVRTFPGRHSRLGIELADFSSSENSVAINYNDQAHLPRQPMRRWAPKTLIDAVIRRSARLGGLCRGHGPVALNTAVDDSSWRYD